MQFALNGEGKCGEGKCGDAGGEKGEKGKEGKCGEQVRRCLSFPGATVADCRGEIHGAGLGLRRAFLEEFALSPPEQTHFIEVAPENWIHVKGKFGCLLTKPPTVCLVCHGLSLNLGGQAALDMIWSGHSCSFCNNIERFITAST